MNKQHQRLAKVFVELADTLVSDFDMVDFLSMLASECADLLDVSAVGVVLADPSGQLHTMAASSERMRILEVLEVQRDEGPARDAFLDSIAVVNRSLVESIDVWPVFAPAAIEAGFTRVHAFPMRLRDKPIGAMNVFQVGESFLDPSDAFVAQALADAATIGIIQERIGREQTALAEQLQRALSARIVIEQAKGILAERLRIDTEGAFRLMRDRARLTHEHLSEIARRVTVGELRDVSDW